MSNPVNHGDHGSTGPSDQDAKPDQHAFMLVGDQVVYGDHQAMFHEPPHQYQVLIRVTLGKDKDGKDAREQYVKARIEYPTMPYVVVNPEKKLMRLSEMIEKGGFPGEIWGVPFNDFEKKWVLAAGLNVKIDRILHNRKFNSSDSELGKPRYLLFGSSARAHMTHYMTRDPDYQLLLDVDSVSSQLSADQLAAGVLIDLEDVEENHKPPSDPLHQYQGKNINASVVANGTKITLKIGATHWFDTTLLNMRPHQYAGTV